MMEGFRFKGIYTDNQLLMQNTTLFASMQVQNTHLCTNVTQML